MKRLFSCLFFLFCAASLLASPMPPAAECKARVEVIKCGMKQLSHPLYGNSQARRCQVLLLDDPVLSSKGYSGEGCLWKSGDKIENVRISGGFKKQPAGQTGEIIDGTLEPQGDEGGTWVDLRP